MHGVSGTPPAELLYSEPVTYGQGWDLAKVYERNRDDWDVAAFHWGSLTSKSSLSALWILLAPFAMANVAGWMSESPNVWSRIWILAGGGPCHGQRTTCDDRRGRGRPDDGRSAITAGQMAQNRVVVGATAVAP